MSSRSDDPHDLPPPHRDRSALSPAKQENRLTFAKGMRADYEQLDVLRRQAEFYRRSGSFEVVRSCGSAIEALEEHVRRGVERYPEFADRELVERLAPVEKKWWERWFLGR